MMMTILNVTTQLLAGLLVLATALPLANIDHWLVRGFDFPRLQIAIGLVLVAALETTLLLGGWGGSVWLLLLVLAALAWQLRWIIEYLPIFPREVDSQPPEATETLKILTSNVLTPNRDAQALLALVREYKPDVLVTLESDDWWQDALSALHDVYPHRLACPLDNLYGMHLYSRWPLHDARIDYLVEDDKPSIYARLETPRGETIRCHFLHPAPPSPSENEESTERDAELLVVARDLADEDGPVIVTGDLNDVAWSRTTREFRKISRLLDPRVGRGMFNTFNAKYWFLRWPLDHIFHSKHFYFKRIIRLPGIGSDHFPLYTELAFHPLGDSAEDRPEVDEEDLAWSKKKMREGDVSPEDVPG